MLFTRSEAELQATVAALVARDPRLGAVLALSGPPPLRRRPQGFEGLAAIVVSQQLSTASAAAIWGRLRAGIEPFHHTALLRARKPKLQRAGLSEGKIKTLRAIAKAVEAGAIDFEALATLSADEAHGMLTAVHGIGPWTADLYLLFCLGHADAWPAGDLALQEAARLAFSLERRPTAKEMIVHAEPWRPWRGVAARLLWAYYRAVKGREAVPVQPAASAKDDNDDTARRPTA
jgi:DNA-3-methyladenine glycosylase II